MAKAESHATTAEIITLAAYRAAHRDNPVPPKTPAGAARARRLGVSAQLVADTVADFRRAA
jgi:hypothetical protein